MSDTFRRRRATYEYAWLLRQPCSWRDPQPPRPNLTTATPSARALLARFHADGHRLTLPAPPRWARKVSDHMLRTRNDREQRRALLDPDYDPVFIVNHRHEARWDWY